MTEFSASDAAIEGFRLAARKPRVILVWSLVQLAASVIFGVATALLIGPDMAKMANLDFAAMTDPVLSQQLAASMLRIEMVTLPIAFLVGAVQSCAVFRAMLRPDDSRFGYLRLGGDELRMLGLFVIYFLGGMAGLFVLVFAISLLAALAGGLGKGVAGLFVALAFLVPLFMAILVLVRLSLAGPITFSERAVRPWRSWAMTRGRFWPLFGAYVISLILFMVVTVAGNTLALLIGSALTHQGLGGLYQTAFRPDSQALAAFFSPARLIVLLVQAPFLGLATAVLYAPAAEVYRMLSGGVATTTSPVAPSAADAPATPRGPWG